MSLRGARMYCFRVLLYTLPAIVASCYNGPNLPYSESAEKALSTLELVPGFEIELVVSEPLISDPVDMIIDENGLMYVVEMHGYPLDKGGTGKIKLLTDENGDGKIDNSTVFVDGLMLPTGIMRWKKGVLVTDAPNVLYLEDTNDDGKADIRDTLLTGFALSNPQHNLNNPLYGLDNWIYLAHEASVATQSYKEEFGDEGEDIFYPEQSKGSRLPKNANGRNVRFRPDARALEMTAAATQFGHTFDAWGHHLLLNNSNHIYQELIAARYLNRNPDLLVTKVTKTLSDHGQPADVFPITKNPQHQLLTSVGVFTSATGLEIYQGELFPTAFNNATFVAEPVSNLVHVDKLSEDGVSYTASRIYQQKEFLASTDSWFRPVNIYTGPDGALYVLDYYRKFIEHPEWMAEAVVQSGELYDGIEKGRIYRITPTGAKPVDQPENLLLGNASIEQLVDALASPNSWRRRNAQRLLVDRKDKDAFPLLKQMAINMERPLGRLHALWTLQGLGQLSIEMIKQALTDEVPGIRENAIRLAELHLDDASLTDALLGLENDENIKVRYQLLLTLGFVDTPSVAAAREKMLFKDVRDEWVQLAALSATSLRENNLLEAVLDQFQEDIPAYASLVQRLSAMIGKNGQASEVKQLLKRATNIGSKEAYAWQTPLLKGLVEGMKSREMSTTEYISEQNALLKAFFQHPSTAIRNASLQLLQEIGLPEGRETKTAMVRAKKIAQNHKLKAERRGEALKFLALGNPGEDIKLLKELIVPDEPLSVQLAALQTLSAIPDQTVSHYVLEHWQVMTPDVRSTALRTFLNDSNRIGLLLDAIQTGQIQKTNIDRALAVSLMTSRDQAHKDLARRLFSEDGDNQRQKIVKQYAASLEFTGSVEEGKQVFQQNCAICHQIGGALGTNYGPDLATIRNRLPASILNDILDPGQSIADGFDLWTVTLNDAESIQGIVSAETPTAITLRKTGGQETTISREDIASLQSLGMSAMPIGLENSIDQEQMANLLAYIKQVK
ncbi:PVC-type heme-binding CxxCH protein [uncultured Kriegella sp.]|uniref:PVC-type heme-binding CxxCH protein n=1 Tax=uncultured Kriegella sp. TaxID=1798910 RepID=UPI0030DCB3D8|tara:strand:- start:186374 stop:189409 length:3036 start_codon:yes stop_codon:yes gene_type:complete